MAAIYLPRCEGRFGLRSPNTRLTVPTYRRQETNWKYLQGGSRITLSELLVHLSDDLIRRQEGLLSSAFTVNHEGPIFLLNRRGKKIKIPRFSPNKTVNQRAQHRAMPGM